jgi:transcriptional regulator with XRE-family HTH domain
MNLSNSEEMMNKEYRHGLVNAQIEIDLPLQIRALRKQLVGNQPDMAKLTGMKQSRVSMMEKPGGVHFTLETLRRLAKAFDVALIVRFAPFSELLAWSGEFSPDTFRVPSFAQEIEARQTESQFVRKANIAAASVQSTIPTAGTLGDSPEGAKSHLGGDLRRSGELAGCGSSGGIVGDASLVRSTMNPSQFGVVQGGRARSKRKPRRRIGEEQAA